MRKKLSLLALALLLSACAPAPNPLEPSDPKPTPNPTPSPQQPSVSVVVKEDEPIRFIAMDGGPAATFIKSLVISPGVGSTIGTLGVTPITETCGGNTCFEFKVEVCTDLPPGVVVSGIQFYLSENQGDFRWNRGGGSITGTCTVIDYTRAGRNGNWSPFPTQGIPKWFEMTQIETQFDSQGHATDRLTVAAFYVVYKR